MLGEKKMKKLIIAAVAGLLVLGAPPLTPPDRAGTSGITNLLAGPAAQATNGAVARRTARRTARRVNRRHNYYRALPSGCVRVGRYWRCGGVY